MEMGYERGASDIHRMDSDHNDSVYRRYGMSSKEKEMNWGVEVVKCNTHGWRGRE